MPNRRLGVYLSLVLLMVFSASARANRRFVSGLPARQMDTAQVLANVRHALHYERFATTPADLVIDGAGRYLGVADSYRLRFAPSGKFVETYTGRLNQTTGFDGKTTWMVDFSGMPRVLEMQEKETAQMTIWVLTGRWLAAKGPLAVSLLPEQSDARQIALRLRLKGGLLESTLLIDSVSWQPRTLRYAVVSGPQEWTFEDYRADNGPLLAHRWTHSDNGLVDSVDVRSILRAAPSGSDPYAPATTRPDDTHFDASVSPQIEVRRAKTGHLFVHPRIDGKDVGWFMLDTGAGAMTIDPKIADSLGMPAFGKQSASGAGALLQVPFRQGVRFSLGPITIEKPLYIGLDLSYASPAFGIPIAGICGYDLFSRAITEVDLVHNTVALYDPSRYALPGGHWEPMLLDSKQACAFCRFEGDRKGLFLLDTGSNGSVQFLTPAVEKLHLLEGRETQTHTSGGAGGMFPTRVGTIRWFEIGGHRFENPRVEFSQTQQGDLTSPYELGNVGQKFLEPFKLVFDYPHNRIAFVHTSEPSSGSTSGSGKAAPPP